jgi:hypothetical protein
MPAQACERCREQVAVWRVWLGQGKGWFLACDECRKTKRLKGLSHQKV